MTRIAEINGLDLNIDARDQLLPRLPPYIPRLRPSKRVDDLRGVPGIAIPLRYVATLAQLAARDGRSAKAFLGLTEDQVLLITGFEHDRFLERAWPLSERYRLLNAIRDVRPDAAIAWNYSVWHRDASGNRIPRIEHLYNIKRSLIIYAQLQSIEVATIPHMYWGLKEDIDVWAGWLKQNNCVSTIAIDLKTVDTDDDWLRIMRDIEYFRSVIHRNILCIFSGVCQTHRIRQLRQVWPESALCNFGAMFAAVFPRKILYDLRQRPCRAEGWSYSEVFSYTARQFTELMTCRGVDTNRAAVWNHEVSENSSIGTSSILAKNVRNGQMPLFSNHSSEPGPQGS